MLWDNGIRNIKFFPYTPPEQFPPYKAEDIEYVIKRINMYTEGTEEYDEEFQKLLDGGLTEIEIKKYLLILHDYWNKRKIDHDNQKFPSLLTQVFLMTFGEKIY